MAVEVFTNDGLGTVTAGGTAATGGSQSLTVTAVNAFPVASASATVPTSFYICDPAAETEKMLVTTAPGGTGAGQSWTVTRGADGTTPVTHAANWTAVQVVAGASLRALQTAGALNVVTMFGADPTGVADSTAAFQACMTAAAGTGSVLPAEMIIPPGTYNLNTGGLNFTGPLKMRGIGTSTYYPSVVTGLSATLPAVTLNCNNSTSLFSFPNVGYLWGGLEMSNISINYTGTGTVFNNIGLADSVFRDMTTVLTQPGSMVMFCTGTAGVLNILHERCTFITTSASRTNPMISLSSSVGANISNNTFYKCRFSNSGKDMTQPMVYIACTGGGSSYHFADNFIECWFEHPFGGAYKSLSGSDIKVDGCMVWDVQGSQTGIATTVAAGSNGGTISGIASWASPSAGVLAVASTAGFPATGRLNVAASGPTTALITYTGIAGNTFTGCVYVSGSPSGTVATGGAVTYQPIQGNSLYYIGAFGAGPGSQGVKITSCGRDLNGPDGISTWDVECESTTAGVLIEGYYTSPLTGTPPSTYNVFLNFHGCQDVVLISNQSPQGSSANGNSTTVVTNPSPSEVHVGNGNLSVAGAPIGGAGIGNGTGLIAVGNAVTAPSGTPTAGLLYGAGGQPIWLDTAGKFWNLAQDDTFSGADAGLLAWNYDSADINNTAYLPASGTVQAIRVNIRRPMSVTNVIVYQQAAGTGLTAAECFAGLYTSAGVQIGVTADQSSAWAAGTQVFKTMALVSGPFTVNPGFAWILLLQNGSANLSWGRKQSFNAAAANSGLSAANSRWATGAAGQTVLPASFTPSSYLTGIATETWAGLS